VSRYRCVDAQKAEQFPVAAAGEAAGVATSAYYAWVASCARGPAAGELAAATGGGQGSAPSMPTRTGSTDRGGSPQSCARRGRQVNHKRVECLMRAHELVGHRPRRRRSLTKPDTSTSPAPDLLGRLFDPDQPDVAWCGDITCIPTDEGGCTWPASSTWLPAPARLVHERPARRRLGHRRAGGRGRRPRPGKPPGTIFHTDRGAEYSSAACANACERLGLGQSMGRTGSCPDNAAAESFGCGSAEGTHAASGMTPLA
jgi:putative transposase